MKDKLIGAWRSWTVWFNAALALALPLYETAKDSLPELQQYLPDNVYKWVGLIAVLINIGLRFRTKLPLEAK